MTAHKPPAVEPNKPVTILEITKRVTALNFCLFLTVLGVAFIPRNLRLGLFATAIFGTMLVISIVEVCRLPRVLKNRVSNDRKALSVTSADFRRAYFAIGTVAVSVLLGLVGELITVALDGFWSNFAIWLAGFVTVLAFYPFRDTQKENPTFTIWAIYAAICGLASVAIAHFVDWLDAGA